MGNRSVMFSKPVLLSLGCLVAWFVLLPALAIGGGIALLAYATLAELGASLTGSAAGALDATAARAIARTMCGGGYGAETSGAGRHYR